MNKLKAVGYYDDEGQFDITAEVRCFEALLLYSYLQCLCVMYACTVVCAVWPFSSIWVNSASAVYTYMY